MEQPCVQFVGVARSGDPPRRSRAALEENAPRLRMEVVPDAGHWLPEEAPEALLPAMLELYASPAAG